MSEFRRRLIAQGEKKVNQFIATYNVTSTSSATKIITSSFIDQIEKMYIDGVEIIPVSTYTFTTTGEHKVKAVFSSKLDTCQTMFSLCKELTSIDTSNLDTSSSTSIAFMFDSTTISSVDLSNLDTSNATSMEYLFSANRQLTSIDISFDIGKITKASAVFNYNTKLTNVNPPYNWKQANISFAQSSKLTPFSVHLLIERASSVAEGATARTLILHATAKANWEASEYYTADQAMATEKLITIQ
jgi:surface protein